MTVDEFIEKWKPSGGNERANTQLFVNDLCAVLGVPSPQPTQADTAANDYVFERHVVKTEIDGATSNGWIDCYKKDCFILEAKQGSDRDRAAFEAGEGESLRDFFGQTAAERFKRGMAKRGTGQWTAAMQKAAGQAEGYAKALPKEHGWPPFLLVSDIGYCIDVYADFSRSGKGYAPFPDRRRFRIELDDLRDEEVRERLKAIWTAPMSLDPSAEAAKVTREIAEILAEIAKRLEKEHHPDKVADFLMRLVFTMFAEDAGFGDKTLLPKESFTKFLRRQAEKPELFSHQLSQIWEAMDLGGPAGMLGDAGEIVRRFNGYLFKDRTALDLTPGEIRMLIEAAGKDWKDVEPAIFGTLLERALNPKERAKLGAHYTPRAYVERLVEPTIMEPLKEDWLGARTAAIEAAAAGDRGQARKIVEAFHGKLARTRVLDPACGTGNFLYVAMARMKELEGEVLELLEELGDKQYLAEISGHTITPENFLGIEINPRAAAIAQLVLWIGYLQWHFKVNGEERMPEPPVLRDVKTIDCRDALIEYDRKELERDEKGLPVTRWDGETMKPHPVTGKPVPDEAARVEVYRYVNPRPAKDWPQAEFVIGNPPFHGARTIGGKSDFGYIDAIREVRSGIPEHADFVMYWWDIAASLVQDRTARRAGLITTKSITQQFSRKITAARLLSRRPISLAFAIPNHPWVDNADGADVRVAFSVIQAGSRPGRLLTEANAEWIDEGFCRLTFNEESGKISPRFTIGTDLGHAVKLKANSGVCSVGYQLTGEGFKVPDDNLRLLQSSSASALLRPFTTARTITTSQSLLAGWVIDACSLELSELRASYPTAFDHLLNNVEPVRRTNSRKSVRERWWIYGEARNTLRPALERLSNIVVTPLTAKHRFFVLLPSETVADSTTVIFALDDAYHLGVLESVIHSKWALYNGGRLGVGDDPRYLKSDCFDPFPFPDTSDEALKQRIRDAAGKLDALRKQVLERHPDLTLTKLYNVLEALRTAEASGGVLGEKDRDIAERGCVSLIRQYHEEIDVGVAEAYGWGDLVPLMRGEAPSPGSPSASPPSPARGEGLEEIILERLVVLNKERAAEEAKGKVRWLRPEYQAPGYAAPPSQEEMVLAEEEKKAAEVLEWPAKLPEQVVAVAGIVERAGRPVAANDVAKAFKGKRASSVVPVLDALAGMGRVRKLEDGRYAA